MNSVTNRLSAIRVNVNTPNRRGYTPLMLAVIRGKTEAVRRLIRQGANLEARQVIYRDTALMYAASYGRLEIARILVDAGANVNARADGMKSPLYFAVLGKHPNLARFLVSRGATVGNNVTKWVKWNDTNMQNALIKRQYNNTLRGRSLTRTLMNRETGRR
jgi:ankyrin repeat protein